jgi:hypothetical protein
MQSQCPLVPSPACHAFSHNRSRNARNETAMIAFALQVVLQDRLLLRHAGRAHAKLEEVSPPQVSKLETQASLAQRILLARGFCKG